MKVQSQHIAIFSLQLSILLMMTPVIYSECNTVTAATETPPKHSTLLPIVERVFSRKKRFLLLTPGGSIKVTVNLGKRLLAQYPRGFNYAIEAATYYEGFSKRIDLIPKFLRKPTTTTPKPAGPTKPIYVYIPGTEIRYKAKPAKKPMKVQRIDANVTALQWLDPRPINKYADPKHWIKYTEYGNTDYQQKYAWTPQKYHYRPKPNAKWTQWSTTMKPKRWWQPRQISESYSLSSDSNGSLPSLHHYHGHRDRRELYQTFEAFSSILGFDMKVCIFRAICECQNLLLPPGYSMLQDMMRAILTLPNHHGVSDEYTDAMVTKAESCEQQYQQKCPINFLNWLMNPMKTAEG